MWPSSCIGLLSSKRNARPPQTDGRVKLLRGAGDSVGGFGGFGSVYDGGL